VEVRGSAAIARPLTLADVITATAGGHRMQTVIDSGQLVTAAARGRGVATPLRLTTTLYVPMAMFQAMVALAADVLMVVTVAHLQQSMRLI
jgi:hypothetical protein